MTTAAKPLLTREELAEALGVRPVSIYRWERRGLIPAVRVTHKIVRYDLADVVAALKARQQK